MGKISYQDIATRLEVVEDKLQFVMNALVEQKQEPTGQFSPDGKPLIRITRRTFVDIYREVQSAKLAAMAASVARDHANRGNAAGGAESADPPAEESFEQLRERLRSQGIQPLPVPPADSSAGVNPDQA